MNKGQIPLIGIAIGGIFTLIASIGGAWMTGSASAQKAISEVNTVVQVVKTTEELHYKELKEDIKDNNALLQKLVDYNNKK